MKTIHGFCPECCEDRELKIVHAIEIIVVRGEEIEANSKYHMCTKCGDSFFDPEDMIDPRTQAFEIYRKRHGMVHPEQIKSFRKKYGLTQIELSSLLGLGGATLSRYENGALQDVAHDNLLQLVMKPKGLEMMLSLRPDAISQEKSSSIRCLLNKDLPWKRTEFQKTDGAGNKRSNPFVKDPSRYLFGEALAA